jgi:hypothetical protein
VKVIKTAHCETDHITWFISVTETSVGSFSLQFEFSCKTHTKHSKEEYFWEVCSEAVFFVVCDPSMIEL